MWWQTNVVSLLPAKSQTEFWQRHDRPKADHERLNGKHTKALKLIRCGTEVPWMDGLQQLIPDGICGLYFVAPHLFVLCNFHVSAVLKRFCSSAKTHKISRAPISHHLLFLSWLISYGLQQTPFNSILSSFTSLRKKDEKRGNCLATDNMWHLFAAFSWRAEPIAIR